MGLRRINYRPGAWVAARGGRVFQCCPDSHQEVVTGGVLGSATFLDRGRGRSKHNPSTLGNAESIRCAHEKSRVNPWQRKRGRSIRPEGRVSYCGPRVQPSVSEVAGVLSSMAASAAGVLKAFPTNVRAPHGHQEIHRVVSCGFPVHRWIRNAFPYHVSAFPTNVDMAVRVVFVQFSIDDAKGESDVSLALAEVALFFKHRLSPIKKPR